MAWVLEEPEPKKGWVLDEPTAAPAPVPIAPATTDPMAVAKELGGALYEGSPLPGLVDTAKLVSMPFRPSSYAGISEAWEKPVLSSEGIGGQLAKGALNVLPMAGALIGGATGVLAGGGIMSPVLGTAGTGLGYGIGERAQKLLQTYFGLYEPKSLKEEWKQTANAVGTGAKAFMQGESGTKMLTMAGAPLAGRFSKQTPEGDTARLGARMVEEGNMPISPDLYNPTPINKFLQWTTDNIIPGGNILANQKRQVVNKTISQMRQDFVEAAGLPNPFTPLKEAKAVKNKAYETFIAEGSGTPIQFPNTAKFIEENINSPALQTSGTLKDKVLEFNRKISTPKKEMLFKPEEVPANQREVYDYLANSTSGGAATVNELNDLLPYIWSRTKSTAQMGKNKNQYQKLTEESVNFRNGLKDAIDSDLGVYEVETGSKVLESLNIARQSTKDMASLGKAKYLEKLLESCTDWNPKTQHWDFQAGKFYSMVTKRKESLQNSYPDEFGSIMNFAEKAKLASGDIARMSPKPAWQQAANIGITGGALGAVYASPILAVPLGFSTFAAWSLMNPTGTVRKLLTTGIKPPTLTKEIIKLGVMKGEE